MAQIYNLDAYRRRFRITISQSRMDQLFVKYKERRLCDFLYIILAYV
jgi:hypothetical protein